MIVLNTHFLNAWDHTAAVCQQLGVLIETVNGLMAGLGGKRHNFKPQSFEQFHPYRSKEVTPEHKVVINKDNFNLLKTVMGAMR